MSKYFVPRWGDRIVLTKDWLAPVRCEHYNISFVRHLNLIPGLKKKGLTRRDKEEYDKDENGRIIWSTRRVVEKGWDSLITDYFSRQDANVTVAMAAKLLDERMDRGAMSLDVLIPAGTCMDVHSINISNKRGYDFITFFVYKRKGDNNHKPQGRLQMYFDRLDGLEFEVLPENAPVPYETLKGAQP